MSASVRLSVVLLSVSLLASIQACADKKFKGATATGNVAKSEPKDAPAGKQDEPAVSPDDPIVTVTPIAASETILERVLSRSPDTIHGGFPASQKIADSFQFTLGLNTGSSTFKLTDINLPKTEKHIQTTRTFVNNSFAQGSEGRDISENFLQTGKKSLVDILIVIDNSGSMDQEQQNLSTKMKALLTSLVDSNWQIGVITTSVTTVNNVDQCHLTLIRSTDTDATAMFNTAINAGVKGSSNEEGFRQAVNGLKCIENPWVRPDSTVAVVIVSDEDNCSLKGADCPNSPYNTEVALETFVEKELGREIGKNAGFYGIFSPPASPCQTAQNIGFQYQKLVDFKGKGRFGSICDANYATTLRAISSDIALLLKNQFELSQIPDANSLKLTVDSVAIAASDYKLSAKTITFLPGKEPMNGKTLVANYRVDSTPLISKVTLNSMPALETIKVRVNGLVLQASDYTVNGKLILFKARPAALAKITVDYRIEGPLNNTFQLNELPLANSLKVKVNGAMASGVTYNAMSNQVIIKPTPIDGATIDLAYATRQGPQLTYRMAVVSGASNIQLFDGNKALSFTSLGDAYTILAADHAVGKVLTLRYTLPNGSAQVFALPHLPDAHSLVFKMDTATCNLNSGIQVNGRSIQTNCTLSAQSNFLLEYTYTELHKSFSLMVPDPEKGKWELSIDGVVTTDYVRLGNTITLNADPSPTALIEIAYSLPE